MNIGSEKQRDNDEKVVEIEMKDVFDVQMCIRDSNQSGAGET